MNDGILYGLLIPFQVRCNVMVALVLLLLWLKYNGREGRIQVSLAVTASSYVIILRNFWKVKVLVDDCVCRRKVLKCCQRR